MAEIVPFHAIRYAATRGRALGQLLAPPYDQVSQEQRDELLRRSPYNVIHLTLGEDRAGDGPTSNRYTRAGAYLRAWLAEGMLLRDPTPALWGVLSGGWLGLAANRLEGRSGWNRAAIAMQVGFLALLAARGIYHRLFELQYRSEPEYEGTK